MPTLEETTSLLTELRAQKAALARALTTSFDAREAIRAPFEARIASTDAVPTAEELEEFRVAEVAFDAELAAANKEIKRINKRIREQKTMIKRRAQAIAESANKEIIDLQVTHEPLTYRSDNAREISYMLDMALGARSDIVSQRSTREESISRLHRHGMEMDVEMPKRAAAAARRATAQAENAEAEFRASVGNNRRGLERDPFERRVAPNRTDGQGGYFVPPLWLIDEYIPGLRAGRVAAGLCRNMDLPPGTDSINIPKLNTLTQVGIQGADSQAVTSQDFTDTSVTANVKTIAGQEDISLQLLEQSPGQIIDQVIMGDLLADYNRLVDRQVIYGTGQNSASLNGGQVYGIYPQTNWAGTNTVTYTDGSPSGQHFVSVLGALASQVSYNRFDLSNFKFLLHPRRWFWYATSLDANGRPLIESNDFGPWNVAATEVPVAPFEGLAGKTPFGPPVYIDANVPITDNGAGASGGTYDVAIGAKWDDLWLFEGELRTRVLPEILSGTLQIRYQVYNYIAFLTRYGQSIALAEGTGFAAPQGSVTSVLF